jgi:hypothetical protein
MLLEGGTAGTTARVRAPIAAGVPAAWDLEAEALVVVAGVVAVGVVAVGAADKRLNCEKEILGALI